jgi:hypothetical protein
MAGTISRAATPRARLRKPTRVGIKTDLEFPDETKEQGDR